MRTTEELHAYEHEGPYCARSNLMLAMTRADVQWVREALVEFMTYQQAKPWVDEDADSWDPPDTTDDAIKARIADYLGFAYEKAENERGISAIRSVVKLRAWVWLLGDDDFLAAFDAAPDHSYGRPTLDVVAARIPPKETNDG